MSAPNTNNSQQNSHFELDDLLSAKEIIAILQRHRQLIAICLVAGLLLSFVYIFFAQPRYTASTSILIDPQQQNILSDILGSGGGFKEHLVIDSQIEVIQSTKLLQKAAERAGIYHSIGGVKKGILSSISSAIFGEEDPQLEAAHQERMRQARFNGFKSGLGVKRVHNTYVIQISYTSFDANQAAQRANLIADVYLDDELEAQYEAAQRANSWIKTRLSKLREELSGAERAVETYKENNNIIQSNGMRLFSDEQLSELNTSLILARSEKVQSKALYDRIKQIIAAGDPDTATHDLMNNGVIIDLRGKYIELSRIATEIKHSQGEEHQAYLNLDRQMKDIQRLIMLEYERIAQSYYGDYEIASSKVAALESELDKVKDTSMVNRRSQIELRELQRLAESTRNLYTKMLDNSNEQTERQSVPAVHARIISNASVPLSPSWPNKRLIIMAGLLLGAAAGVALAFFREQFDKFIWKSEELEAVTKRTCLGMLPKIAFDGAKLGNLSKYWPRDANETDTSAPVFNIEGFSDITQLLNKQTGVTTEIMRNIQLAVKFKKPNRPQELGKVISFVSARPGEGKSITSCFLAKHLARGNAKVALIDCDFRRPSLTHWFMPNAHSGFYELASQLDDSMDEAKLDAEIESICFKAADEPLVFIPAKGANTSIGNLNLVSSGQMRRLILELQKRFDAILIDLPPIINIVDARVIADSIDSFIFLAHWGKTDRDLVNKALLRAPEVYNKTAGTLLTLVDTEKAGSYGYYHYNYYYHR